MIKLLKKEIKLSLSAVNYIFLLFAFMFLIPNYPFYVSFFYYCVSVLFIFNNSELNKDLQYSMILPITKKDIVKARCLLVYAYEIIGILLSIPFAILNTKIYFDGNPAGIDMNSGTYGLLLIPLTFFNLIFISMYYKKAEKPRLPFFIASISYWLIYSILEFPFWINNEVNLKFIDNLDTINFIPQIQLPILFSGILIYILGFFLTYKISSANFEKVDL
ncbi:MAG: ABC-2 transporter permease [Treponema sp.]|nr:ABC-2 transporter permease [Treponema sp.]